MEYVAKNRDYIIIRQFLQLYHLYHSYVFHDYNGICHHTVFPNGISKLGYGEKWENGRLLPITGKGMNSVRGKAMRSLWDFLGFDGCPIKSWTSPGDFA